MTLKTDTLWRVLAKRLLKRADMLVCLSPTLKDEISRQGIEQDKIRYILLGVDTEEYKSMQEDEE